MATYCFDFSAPQTSPSRISAPAVSRAPERATSSRLNHGSTKKDCDFSALQTSPFRISAPAGFPSPGEGRQEEFESFPSGVCLQASPSRISAPAGFPSPSFSARCWFWLWFRVPKESKSQETYVGFSGRVIRGHVKLRVNLSCC